MLHVRPVPTIDELGVREWFPNEKDEKPDREVDYDRWNSMIGGGGEPAQSKEYSMLNAVMFLVFWVPAALAIILRQQMSFFYYWVIVWVHEAGHGFWNLSGNMLIGAFGGFLNEMLFTAVPALICLKKRESYLAACVLLMCAGMSLEFNGAYMQSAVNPNGTSFAGALTRHYNDMSYATHDWSQVYTRLGLLDSSYEIGLLFEAFGKAMAVIFFSASMLAMLPTLLGWVPGKFSGIYSPGAAAALAYFLAYGGGWVEILLSLAMAAPLAVTAYRRLAGRRINSP